MRLICPNCDAEYEVDDAVIPSGGRDVQCSNCGHTWFQVAAGEEAVASEAPAKPSAAPPPDETSTPTEAAETPADDDETYDDAEVAAPQPKRQELDDAVLGVLREEAEREAEARRTEGRSGASLESQPELGLGGARTGLQERMARLRGVASSETVGQNSPRRDLLPDIEEINSTLRATSERQSEAAIHGASDEALENDPLPRKRGSFGFGFGLVILIAALLIGLYMLAPTISAAVPAAKPFLQSYVIMMDKARIALNSGLVAVTQKLTGIITSLTSK